MKKNLLLISLAFLSILATSCSALYSELKSYSDGDVVKQEIKKHNGEVVTSTVITKKNGNQSKALKIVNPAGIVTEENETITVNSDGTKNAEINIIKKADNGTVYREGSGSYIIDSNGNIFGGKLSTDLNYESPVLTETETFDKFTIDSENADIVEKLAEIKSIYSDVETYLTDAAFVSNSLIVTTDDEDNIISKCNILEIIASDGTKVFRTVQTDSSSDFTMAGFADASGNITENYVYDSGETKKSTVTFTTDADDENKQTAVYENKYYVSGKLVENEVIEQIAVTAENPLYDFSGLLISNDELSVLETISIYENSVLKEKKISLLDFSDSEYTINREDIKYEASVTTTEMDSGFAKVYDTDSGDAQWYLEKAKGYTKSSAKKTESSSKTETVTHKETYKQGEVKKSESDITDIIYSDGSHYEKISAIDFENTPDKVNITEKLHDGAKNLIRDTCIEETKDSSGKIIKTVTESTEYKTSPYDGSYSFIQTEQDADNKYVKAQKNDYDADGNLVKVNAGNVFTANIQAQDDISVTFTQTGDTYVFTVPSGYSGISWSWLGEKSMNGTANGNSYTLNGTSLVNGVYSLYVEDNANHSVQINITISR